MYKETRCTYFLLLRQQIYKHQCRITVTPVKKCECACVVLETYLTGQMAWCYELHILVMRTLHWCTWTAEEGKTSISFESFFCTVEAGLKWCPVSELQNLVKFSE